VRLGWVAVLVTAGFWTACSRGPQTTEAVRQGVLDHLASRPDLDLRGIEVQVNAVSFRQNEAEATVSIRPRAAEAGGAFQMRYTLERKGGRWVVKSKAEAGGGHGGAMGLPPGHPQVGGSAGGGGERPTR